MKCCNIKLGDLNRRIEIQSLVKAPDGQGGKTVTWPTFLKPWAKLKPMRGREVIQSDRLIGVNMTQVIIRYRDDIDDTMRVVYKNQNYQIRSVVNLEDADIWLELMIERIAAQ